MRAGLTKIRARVRQGQRVLTLLAYTATLALFACSSLPALRPAPAALVRTGLDVLLEDSVHIISGRRVGLITNHTGLDRRGVSGIDRLHAHPGADLVALFGPEHSISGREEAGVRVGDARDTRTGLPVYSLYGETRKPTARMLQNVDVLIFDIQDIGTRYYTYMWTMALALQAAAEHGRHMVVLDRPNPIRGDIVNGNVLDTAFATFVGLYPVPMRHGMTVGEMARMLNAEFGINARLTVVPLDGWRRDMWFEQTGLPWVAPSPNMPSIESALHYPGTCLFEGTNLSVGRGTDTPFQHVGAPWLDAEDVIDRLERYGLPGVRFEAVRFTPRAPGDGKFNGVAVNGIRFVATNRSTYDPAVTAIAALAAIRAEHDDELAFRDAHFDRLAGTARVRLMLLADEPLESITADWQQQRAQFERMRARYLLYP
jgi:uncharacterized protein YbbC (DUF1343 family)